ncbi:MAG TPA: TylF/MycF/NovP-related O-methyltransferase [Bryobacteraceae bacterium]
MKQMGMLLNGCEAYQLIEIVRATAKIPGEIAEVGVFRGGSARLICEHKGGRELYLFDTWSGLPQLTEDDGGSGFFGQQFAASLENVKNALRAYSGVHFLPGPFPQTAEPVRNRCFSFVHLDVDLYEATRDALEFFYPRLARGAALMSHDFHAPGVRKAIEEFFADKPEIVIQQPAGSHIVAIKL